MAEQRPRTIDCLIVGGGPAGLTAAIYAARFRLTVRVIDAGDSRALQIPCTRNHAGFPDGISGRDLVGRMRAQALKAGAAMARGRVSALGQGPDGFRATCGSEEILARAVLLATGITDRRPRLSEDLHAAAVAAGRLRYCPVCDGFEVMDQNVAVIGTGARGMKEALFLRAYTATITLAAPWGPHDLSADQRASLKAAGIVLVDGPVGDFELLETGLAFTSSPGRQAFEAVYPALGADTHSQLAVDIGAEVTGDGCIKVDAHQRTSVRGAYAAGDAVIGLDQISHAMGEAGVAATTIRNDLAGESPIRR